MRFNIDLRGIPILGKILAAAQKPDFMTLVAQGVYAEASAIMLTAKRRVPLDQGTLRASGIVNQPVVFGTSWSLTMGFGGAASAYALIQHENLTFNHRAGRSAKYLENPVIEDLGFFQDNLAKRVAKAFAKSGL